MGTRFSGLTETGDPENPDVFFRVFFGSGFLRFNREFFPVPVFLGSTGGSGRLVRFSPVKPENPVDYYTRIKMHLDRLPKPYIFQLHVFYIDIYFLPVGYLMIFVDLAGLDTGRQRNKRSANFKITNFRYAFQVTQFSIFLIFRDQVSWSKSRQKIPSRFWQRKKVKISGIL